MPHAKSSLAMDDSDSSRNNVDGEGNPLNPADLPIEEDDLDRFEALIEYSVDEFEAVEDEMEKNSIPRGVFIKDITPLFYHKERVGGDLTVPDSLPNSEPNELVASTNIQKNPERVNDEKVEVEQVQADHVGTEQVDVVERSKKKTTF
ncbi:unnamed protein product [Arabidopsis arenosa]|uniref:Uncharacterized protein n=1 Tax=Arabidopsis arenosa TaxID=38785 RepID=A0A8S2A589_ARAAE|nr:unnamed protein product [Arabidopsis arenosa]